MQSQYDNTTLSYVNIGSSILRNKFEKNRVLNSKKPIEPITELSEDDKLLILNKKLGENEVRFINFLKESKKVESSLSSLNTSLNEINERFEDKIKNVNLSIRENREFVDRNIKTINSSMSELNEIVNQQNNSVNSSMSELNEIVNQQNKSFNSSMSELNETVNQQNKSFNSSMSELNESNEDKMNDIILSMGEIKSKIENFYVKSEIESNMKSINSSVALIGKKVEDHITKTKPSEVETFNFETSDLLKLLIENLLPKDFDYKNYQKLNEDLKEYNEFNLKKHYLLYGKIEKRIYKSLNKNAPDDFDWKEYLRMNIDILKSFNDEYNTTGHYIKYGIYEKRMYKMSQLEDVNFFIYCGRKSGSTTLNHTCSNIDNCLSIQIHNNEDYLYKYGQCSFNSIFDLLENNMKKHETVYIIDSYRTPIEKKISSFFEDIEKYIPNYKDCDISFLISYFNKKYIYGNKCTHIYTEDYEPLDEMLEHFNLSPIKKFNFDQQFEIIKHKNLVFIKLRFHEIEKWDVLLSKILGKDVTIIDKNKSENKDYYDVYENFKKNYRIPKEYLEKLKSDSRFKIYNSSLERIKYIKDWSSKSLINS
jgi:hypothetical protein